MSELRAGNLEFSITASELEQKLNNSALPEVAYFMQNFVPACALPLDGILKSRPIGYPLKAGQNACVDVAVGWANGSIVNPTLMPSSVSCEKHTT